MSVELKISIHKVVNGYTVEIRGGFVWDTYIASSVEEVIKIVTGAITICSTEEIPYVISNDNGIND